MKRILISLLVLLCSNFTTQAQLALSNIFSSEKITFPVNGSVFQMDNSNLNTHVFKFSGQTTSNFSLRFSLYRQTSEGAFTIEAAYNNIPLTYKSCASGGCADGVRLFDYTGSTNLTKGWYRIVVYREYQSFLFTSIIRRVTKSVVDFGVGDVYFIAGQSNASGWFWNDEFNNQDNAISTTGETAKSSPMARTLTFKEDNVGQSSFAKAISKGIPYNSKLIDNPDINFNELRNPATPSTATAAESGRINIYPNGYNSWAYGPLAYKMATNNSDGGNKFSGIPSLWFNCAVGGTSINTGMGYNSWQNNPDNETSLQGKLDYTIFNFGGAFGAKAVLWHQGEYDHLGYLKAPSSNSDYITDYKNGLSKIIEYSRQSIDNSGTESSKLNWFISDVSYTPYSRINPAPSGSTGVNFTKPIGYIDESNTDQAHWTSATLKSTGQSTSLFRPTGGVFANIPANSPHLNLFKGPLTDDMIGVSNRTNRYLIHFSGTNPLNELGQRWYNSLYNVSTNNSVSNVSVKASPLIPLLSVEKSGSTYTLKIPAQSNSVPNAPAIRYYWVRNSEVPVANLSNPSGSSIGVFTNNAPGDYLVGYVFKDGRLHPVQPFLVPGGSAQSKNIRIANPNLNISASGGSVSTEVVAVACDWEIVNLPANFSVSYNEPAGTLSFSAGPNTTGSAKTEIIALKEVGGNYAENLVITQPAASGITTSLTSLNPTNSSSEWQGYGTARFNGTSIDGNVINIGGTQYTQGIGTHANSRIVYNLNNAYSTFSCKFGMDQESNCCDGATFTIKADGQTIYGPVTKVWGQAATVVNGLSVAGKSTLELITDQISNNYADHTDWADVYLQSGPGGCGTPPIAPSPVSATPSSIINGGSSTLSATCAYGTATWSTGATGSSSSVSPGVTTNYTVKCVSVGCPDSPVVGVTVNVSNSPCSAVTDNLVMGAWTVTNHPLVARYFNNQYWLTQRIGTNPEQFLVRGSNMLTRGDVTLNNGSYSSLTTCFGWQNSNYGGLAVPNSTQFPTPAGFTLAYESDGTPFYTANGSCGLTAPTSVSASPASIISGQSSTLSATCATGTRLWSTGATSATIVVSPTSTTTYTVKCTQSGCPDSPTSSVTVQVGPCASLSHNLVMGTWNVTGHQLVAKYYHNQWWLVQRIASNPEKFLVRGSEMLTRGDVTLTNGSYSSLVGCFQWAYSAYGGLGTPNSTQFPTPSGWQYGTEPDGTPFYTSTGGARVASDQDFIKETVPSFISIYPNPNQGTFSIKVYLETASSLDIDLINSTGKIYQSIKAEGKEGQNEIPFTTQNISSGNYLIRVKTKDKVESMVVVIR